jgi:intracellular septation protein
MKTKPIKWLSFFGELIPLILFFVGFNLSGLYLAAILSVSAGIILFLITWYRENRFSGFIVISILFSLVFLILAMILNETLFIKVQPSVSNLFFGVILIFGHAGQTPMMKRLFSSQFQLTEATWRSLSLRWGWFFLLMAAANEMAWRGLSEANWMLTKVFVFPIVTISFMALLWPMTKRGLLYPDDDIGNDNMGDDNIGNDSMGDDAINVSQ